MSPLRKDQPTDELINDFLKQDDSLGPKTILEEIVYRTVERKLDIETFLKCIRQKNLSWEKFVEVYKGTKRYKQIAILFYFLTEIRKKFPWAVTYKEFFKDINENRGEELKIEKTDMSKTFRFLKGGQTWGSVIRALLGEQYLPVKRHKKPIIVTGNIGPTGIPIYWDIKELLLRVLLMGNGVNSSAISSVLKIYNQNSVFVRDFTPATKSPWFECKGGIVVKLHPKLREAVSLFLDENIQEQWKKSIEEEKVEFYFKERK